MQQEKIVNAILRLDADIIGLMEIENNGFGDILPFSSLLTNWMDRIERKKDRYTFVAVDSNVKMVWPTRWTRLVLMSLQRALSTVGRKC